MEAFEAGWNLMAAAWVFGMGLILGSFANVAIHRLPLGLSVVKPRSRCPQCRHSLAWFDNIPVLSFVLLQGKCRSCRAPIDARYPVIELVTALLLSAVWLKHQELGWIVLRPIVFAYILLIVSFIDLEHRLIPDELSLGGLALGLATAVFDPRLDEESLALRLGCSAGGAALGFAIFAGFSFLYWRITRRHGLGGGDVKLLAMIGAFAGPWGVIVTLFLSSVSGSVVGILWGLATRQKGLRQVAIPYGPFLAIGALVYDLMGDFGWFRFMNPT